MKTLFYISVIALIVTSCSSSQYTTGIGYEDDLYYNPKEKPLVIQEVEKELPDVSVQEKNELLEIAKKTVKADPEKYPDITSLDKIEIESVEYKTNPETGAIDTIIQIMSQGYWINGFRGSNAELEEAMRTIDQYPNGFGYFGHGDNIGENLSFDSDWNVYTRDGKYWWFPRVTNLTMYNQFMFGRYPRYEWTVIWDSPNYDYWDFDFHFGYSSYWRWRTYDRWYYRSYWYEPYWHYSYHVDPWYHYNSWYDYPYYRRNYKRHSDPNWYRNNYRYGPRRSMSTQTLRTPTNTSRYSPSGSLKTLQRGTTTRNRSVVPTRRGSTTIKSRTGTSGVSPSGTGSKSRYRSTGTTVRSKSGGVKTQSRYSSQSTRTRSTTGRTTTTQSRKTPVRRYSKPRSTSRPSYNKSKSGKTYQRSSGRKDSGSSYNRGSSESNNKSESGRSRTYNPSSRSRSGSSSGNSNRSSSRSRSSSSSSRSRTR